MGEEAGRWARGCCCGELVEEEERNGKEDVEMEESRSSSPLEGVQEEPGPVLEPQPYWFHTLQTKRSRIRRERSNSDPLGERQSQEGFTWRPGLQFGVMNSYVSLEKLGEGSYASVFKGISRINGQLVALKVIRMKTDEGVPFTAIREASLLKGLKHANIVLLHDIIHGSDSLTLVFEYVVSGFSVEHTHTGHSYCCVTPKQQTDLAQYMSQHPGGLHSHNIRLFMFQLLRGLSFIHGRHILHRDLKPQNLLISHLGELKLADFGLARSKSIPSQTFSSEVVTLWYRPPDVLLGSTNYSTAVDIWGAGCIFVEMLQGAPAFPGNSDALEQLHKIWMVFGVPSEQLWPGVSQLPLYQPDKFVPREPKALRNTWKRLQQLPNKTEALVQQLLTLVPENRPSASKALQHQYFSTLPPAVHHLRDTVSVFKVPGVHLETEVHDLCIPARKVRPSLLQVAKRW
ncbi:cyclin-dependent kinase 15 isoform X1 [Synchiropus splendidus]|uniref:cyclin-dependent kinase 15 isoform X1 n=1 Tax=Synchiropus splendidus TaxID=270530 RepID=UPI00237DEC76|nr:cyclin-dependent kinase 15 isoform X1 [Synchiropus splendidus]